MPNSLMFWVIVAILVSSYVLERVGEFLDLKSMSGRLPERLQGVYDAERYQKMQAYEKETTRFSLFSDTFSFLLTLGFLWFQGFAWIDNFWRGFTQNEVFLALLFFGSIGFASDILSLPFSLYSTFVIETKAGFNKTTPTLYFFDKLKSWAISLFLGGGMLAAFIWFYHALGSNAWWIAWVFVSIVMVFMAMFYTSWIVPLFNKLTPLESGELKQAIQGFCQKAGFNLNNLFVIDGSKRSTRANAYFSGLGPKKMIVLYDTLIKNQTTEELVAILAHEIGHYKRKHVLKSMALSFLQTGFILFVLQYLLTSPNLSSALGSTIPSIHLGLVAFGILFTPISLLIGMGMNLLSRKNEFEADAFAAKTYKAAPLKSALVKLSSDNLSNLQPHPFNVFLSYSHPTLLQRLEALDKLD
jgi:STE24 endopeptidase